MFVDILVNTIPFAKHKWNFLFDKFDLFWRQDLNFPLPNPTQNTNVSTLLVRPSLLLDSKHLSYRIPWASTVRVQLAKSAVHGPFPHTCKGPYIPANSAGFQVIWNGRISWHCWFQLTCASLRHMYEPLHDAIILGAHSASAHPCPYDSIGRQNAVPRPCSLIHNRLWCPIQVSFWLLQSLVGQSYLLLPLVKLPVPLVL